MTKPKAVYPGTFDPVTYGHLDVLDRAAGIFRTVTISVAESTGKNTLFSLEERLKMIRNSVKSRNIRIESFSGLLVDYAARIKAGVIVRGLRAISDFEYEFKMALINRKIAPEIETVFLMPNEKYSYISSTFVKEIAKFGGDVSAFVPPSVREMLKKKFVSDIRKP
jgi:pantetheine-phosphate adenylyltransferase